eukprot:m.81718 g.81718  ORF g.81718 m.81718 type:complete len:385 (+) comp14883_c0_seq1:178-1332(+)
MDAIEKELEKSRKRQRVAAKDVQQGIEKMIAAVDDCSAALSQPEADAAQSLRTLQKVVKTQTESIQTSLTEQQNPTAKLGKALEKAFQTTVPKLCRADIFEGKELYLNRVIADHLFRTGRFKIAEDFLHSAEPSADTSRFSAFRELHAIINDMKQQSSIMALRWIDTHRSQLGHAAIDLEFKLRRLELSKILAAKNTHKAMTYIRMHFQKFMNLESHHKEVRHLLGALLYVNKLAFSEYSDILDPHLWTDATHSLTRECCALLGLPHESPLYVSVNAGCTALPMLLKVSQVLATTNHEDGLWTQTDELPVEIELGKDRNYHTWFTCPVSREHATDANPPMRLPCGHVICNESLIKMAKNSSRRRFKCAYCPRELTLTELKRIWF